MSLYGIQPKETSNVYNNTFLYQKRKDLNLTLQFKELQIYQTKPKW